MGLRERGHQRSVRNIHLQINCVMLETFFQIRTRENGGWRRETGQFTGGLESGDRSARVLYSAFSFVGLQAAVKKCLK